MSAQNPIASSAATRAAGSRREKILAGALAAGAVSLFVVVGLRAGAAPVQVLAVAFSFAWLFMACIVLGTRLGVSTLRAWVAPAPWGRGAFLLILVLAGFVAYALAARATDPRAFAGLSVPMAGQLVGLEAALLLVTVVKPLSGIGYSFEIDLRDLVTAGVAISLFAIVAIPLGIALGFIRPDIRAVGALERWQVAFKIIFMVTLPEELVFRGLLQNVLERRAFAPRRWWMGLGVAALIFGAAHLQHPPRPNWRYGILAALAGIAYGWTWHRTGKITASAVVHAAVDLVWIFAFGGP